MAYEWGGWDRSDDFLSLLNLQYNYYEFFKPGAYKDNDCEPDDIGDPFWAIGSDCSGLVSRAWNLSYKRNTSGLAYESSLSTQLPGYYYLLRGDILDWPYNHVAIFYGWIQDTVMTVIEETPPRAIKRNWTLYKYKDYTPYRYNYVAGVPNIPGDVNSDGTIDLSDAVYLSRYLLQSGPSPNPLWKGDVNGDCKILLSDVILLVRYVFYGSPAPWCNCSCWSCI